MQGFLEKMRVHWTGADVPVDYYLRLGDDEYHLNPFIGCRITLAFRGNIQCRHCGTASRKSYGGGYCYPCFKSLAQCDLCLVSPDRCHYAEGTCREPEWGERFCMQPHLVYIANSSGIKVGITKDENLPMRWIDQGAVQATVVAEVDTRQQAGFVEVAFGHHISDRTQWQQMLKAEDRHIDLAAVRERLLEDVEHDLAPLRERFGTRAIRLVGGGEVTTIRYPVERYPTRVVALSFDKTPVVEGVLTGIKGQYLLLDTGVINLRRFTAYDLAFTAGERVIEPGEPGQGESLRLF